MAANCTVTQGQTGPIISCVPAETGSIDFSNIIFPAGSYSTTITAILIVFAALVVVSIVILCGNFILSAISQKNAKPIKKRRYYPYNRRSNNYPLRRRYYHK